MRWVHVSKVVVLGTPWTIVAPYAGIEIAAINFIPEDELPILPIPPRSGQSKGGDGHRGNQEKEFHDAVYGTKPPFLPAEFSPVEGIAWRILARRRPTRRSSTNPLPTGPAHQIKENPPDNPETMSLVVATVPADVRSSRKQCRLHGSPAWNARGN
jgi:hypothetical protein